MSRIRVAIVDDEPLARRGIRARLEQWPQVDVVVEAADASGGVSLIGEQRPDVLFLDIEMPGADGFAVLDQLSPQARPLVVFVTAHEDRALRAFDAEAFDYVLKPIDDARFGRTMERIIARLAERNGRQLDRLIIRDRGRAVALDPATIDWVKSDGDYVRIYAGRGNYLHHATLTSLSAELPPDRFVRIHRTTIVNVERIHALAPLTNGDYAVLLTTGARLKLSRTHRDALRGRLEGIL
ncbi:MAG TPA: LytTR family DNA-binding domain-containing protein [Gemmatimonadaceae bacterium]|nr:LytTR family DNA-binding domain-containing protein [Gemmatimonadaceae bacterium]